MPTVQAEPPWAAGHSCGLLTMPVGVLSFHTSLCSQVSDYLLAPVVCQMLGVLSSENAVKATALGVYALVGVDVEEGGVRVEKTHPGLVTTQRLNICLACMKPYVQSPLTKTCTLTQAQACPVIEVCFWYCGSKDQQNRTQWLSGRWYIIQKMTSSLCLLKNRITKTEAGRHHSGPP